MPDRSEGRFRVKKSSSSVRRSAPSWMKQTDPLEHRLQNAAAQHRRTVWLSLFATGVGPNSVTSSGLTPLRAALNAANWGLADWLLTRGARVPTEAGPWFARFIDRDQLEQVGWLLRNGASFHVAGPVPARRRGEAGLALEAVLKSSPRRAQRVWRLGAHPDPTHPEDISALGWVLYHQKGLEWVDLVLAAGADPNRAVWMQGQEVPRSEFPLHAAVRYTQNPTVRHQLVDRLLAAGANPAAVSSEGQTVWGVWAMLHPKDSARLACRQRQELAAALPSVTASRLLRRL